jgi:pyrroloquinoline quinone (PQQ) biosynthesis protein C
VDARVLVDEVREEGAAVRDVLLRHPYVAAVERGDLELASLRPFAGEQHHVISSDLRSVAQLVARWGGDFLLGVLDGERAALAALPPFAAALGMSAADLESYEPAAGAHAYAAYMAWLGGHAAPAEVAAAYLVNFQAWGESCRRLSRALTDRYGLSRDQVRFFDQFAQPLDGFEADALAVIQDGLDRGTDPRLVRRAARLLQAYELLYWDTLAALLPG